METGDLRNLDTAVFYCPFFLLKKRKKKQVQISWMDANLIRVAPKHRDIGGLAYPYRGAFDQNAYFLER
jgi:hypothetical protein